MITITIMKRCPRSILVFMVLAGIMSGWVQAGEAPLNDWPIYHGDSGLRGVAQVALPDVLGVKWRARIGAPAVSAPVVCGDRIVLATEGGGLQAFSRQGKPVWSFALPKPANPVVELQENFSTPPLLVSGLVLIGSGQGYLYAFDAASGEKKWRQRIGDDVLGSPNWVGPGSAGDKAGVLVMSRWDGVLKMLSLQDGHVVWASKPMERCDSSPAVGTGVAVIGACDAAVHVLSLTNGTALGMFRLEDDKDTMAGGAAVDGGQAFTGTRKGSVLCVDVARTSVIWSNRCSTSEIFTTPAVTSNRVVVGANDGRVYCLNRDNGTVVWSVKTAGNPSSPLIAGDKVVVASEGTLYLLSLADGRKIWTETAGDSMTEPAVTSDGIFVGTDDGFLVLFSPLGKPQEKP